MNVSATIFTALGGTVNISVTLTSLTVLADPCTYAKTTALPQILLLAGLEATYTCTECVLQSVVPLPANQGYLYTLSLNVLAPGALASPGIGFGPTGALGPVGPQGPVGPVGPAGTPGGPVGPQGVAGTQGVQGLTGGAGPAGVAGPTGPQGVQGPVGPSGGPVGPAGPQGVQGPAGVAGPQGVQGVGGPAGVAGPTGLTGPGGPLGPTGLMGLTGPAGVAGPQGVQGLTGATGPGGATGSVGVAGGQGPQGIQGPISVVWQPGGVAADNVYTSWPTALAAAIAASAAGMVSLGIDGSIAPAVVPSVGMPVGGWDMQGRIILVNGNSHVTTAFPTVSVPDGATLTNIHGWNDVYLLGGAGASGLPSLSYTRSLVVTINRGGMTTPGATAPIVQIAAGVDLTFLLYFASIRTSGVGSEMFAFAGAGSLVLVLSGSNVTPAKNVVRGAAGASFLLARDTISSSVLLSAAFTGASTFVFSDKGTIQTEGDVATGVGGGLTFVVDATALSGTGVFTQTVYCRGAGGAVTVQLPNPALGGNKFRQLLIIDDDGTSGATPIVLVPFAGTALNGVIASKNLTSNWGMWMVTMNGTRAQVAQLQDPAATSSFGTDPNGKVLSAVEPTFVTAGATPTNCATAVYAMPDLTLADVLITVTGKKAASADHYVQDFRGRYTRNGGAPVLSGAVIAGSNADASGTLSTATATLVISGNSIIPQVTGVAATNVTWSVTMQVQPVTTAT